MSTQLDALPPRTTAPPSTDDFAARLRGFGPLGLLAVVVIRRSLFLLMCAHAAFDLTAYALIYRNLESTVAHLVFR